MPTRSSPFGATSLAGEAAQPARKTLSKIATNRIGASYTRRFAPDRIPQTGGICRRFHSGRHAMSHVMNTYARQPVAFVRGEGVWLWDEAGRKYLDALAGIAVNTLGYAHPRFLKAMNERVKSGVIHTSNLFR